MQCILNVHVDVLLMSFGYPATLGALESDIYRVLLRADNDCPNTVKNIRPHACIVSDRKRVLNISKTTTAERGKKNKWKSVWDTCRRGTEWSAEPSDLAAALHCQDRTNLFGRCSRTEAPIHTAARILCTYAAHKCFDMVCWLQIYCVLERSNMNECRNGWSAKELNISIDWQADGFRVNVFCLVICHPVIRVCVCLLWFAGTADCRIQLFLAF